MAPMSPPFEVDAPDCIFLRGVAPLPIYIRPQRNPSPGSRCRADDSHARPLFTQNSKLKTQNSQLKAQSSKLKTGNSKYIRKRRFGLTEEQCPNNKHSDTDTKNDRDLKRARLRKMQE